MESNLYSLLKVDIRNLVRSEASLLKNLYLPPSEVECLPYWQYELLTESLEELFKKDKEEQENGDGVKMPKGMPSLKDIQSGKYTPKMPSMPKMPSI
jgi:hypothetical protein